MVATKTINTQREAPANFNKPQEQNWLSRIIEWILNFLGLSEGKAAQKASVIAQTHFEAAKKTIESPVMQSRLPPPRVIAGIPEKPIEPKNTVKWLQDLDKIYTTPVLIEVLGFKQYDAYVDKPVISEKDYCALEAKCQKAVAKAAS